ncbi:hypothetical protein EMIHUDRAFT_437118, partial [Emiliania huxleyi CCMP1516]|uniref:Uncharacterized protein n=2 Tax=Emiliania huxleyi TaxID=2903 RepID=A0A0D3IQL6_EMIH1
KCYHQQRRRILYDLRADVTKRCGSVLAKTSVVLPHTHGLTVCRQSPRSVAHTSRSTSD